MPTVASSSAARSAAARRLRPRCSRSGSATWAPIVRTGFSAAIGSWYTSPMPRPRILRISGSLRVSSSRPSSRTEPVTRAMRGSSRSSDRQVTLLPEPDSPTIATVWPRSTEKLTPFTACTVACSVANRTFRSVTVRVGVTGPPGEVVPGHPAVLHHEADLAHRADVGDRVAVDHDDVRDPADLQRPDLRVQAEVVGRVLGRRDDRGHRAPARTRPSAPAPVAM